MGSLDKSKNGLRVGVAQAAMALLITLALCCSGRVCVEAEGEAFAPALLSALGRAFAAEPPADLAFFAGALVLLRFARRRAPGRDGWALGLSGLFALLMVLSQSFMRYNSLAFFNADAAQTLIALLCAAGYWALFYPVLRLVFAAAQRLEPAEPRDGDADRLWLPGFLLILACWLPWLLCNYPGSFCADSRWQLEQFFGVMPFTGHHPPLSTALMGSLAALGQSLGSVELGCFLYCLLQSLLGAAVFSAAAVKLRAMGLSWRFCLTALLFYAVTPLWGASAQFYNKDLLYSEAVLLNLLLLADIIRNRACSRGDMLRVTAVTLLAALLRNNGIYEFAPLLLALLFRLRGVGRRRCLAAVCAVMLIYGGVTRGLYPALGIRAGSVREALSIPFQQTARAVWANSDTISPDEREAIDGVLMYDELKQLYSPVLSDPVKDTYRGDSSKLPGYFKVWLRMLFEYPREYISAFINLCYGHLAPVTASGAAVVDEGLVDLPALTRVMGYEVPGGDYEALDMDALLAELERREAAGYDYSYYTILLELKLSRPFDGTAARLFRQINQLGLELPVIKYLSFPGLYTWLLLGCWALLLRNRRWSALLLIPGTMNVLVCIAGPTAVSFRYILPLAASMPLLLGWCRVSLGSPETRTPKGDAADPAVPEIPTTDRKEVTQ